MKKLLLIALAVTMAVPFAGSAGERRKKDWKRKNIADSVSYAMGVDLGRYLRSMNDVKINELILQRAIRETLREQSDWTPDEASEILREYFTVRIPMLNLEKSERYLDALRNDPDIKFTESGIAYRIENPGTGRKAIQDRDQVRVHYEGKLMDGTVFDSSYERGEDVTFALNRVIKGWTEGMKLIGEGGEITLWIHPDMAYGINGQRQGGIGPNDLLIFRVQLFEVIPYDDEE